MELSNSSLSPHEDIGMNNDTKIINIRSLSCFIAMTLSSSPFPKKSLSNNTTKAWNDVLVYLKGGIAKRLTQK